MARDWTASDLLGRTKPCQMDLTLGLICEGLVQGQSFVHARDQCLRSLVPISQLCLLYLSKLGVFLRTKLIKIFLLSLKALREILKMVTLLSNIKVDWSQSSSQMGCLQNQAWNWKQGIKLCQNCCRRRELSNFASIYIDAQLPELLVNRH